MNVKYRVDVYEHERGWGMTHDGHRDFDTLEEAQEYQREFNERHCPPLNGKPVPDYYVTASAPRLIDLDQEKK